MEADEIGTEMDTVPRQSILRPTTTESAFLKAEDAIKQKEEGKLTELLKERYLFSMKNEIGVSLLERTVEADWCEGMVLLLGSKKDGEEYIKRLNQALLLGIHYDNLTCVTKCLEIQDVLKDERSGQKHKGNGTIVKRDKVDLTQHSLEQCFVEESVLDVRVSPISLAVNLQRRDIVRLLMDRGFCELHPVTNVAEGVCSRKAKNGECLVCDASPEEIHETSLFLEDSHKVINTYRALSSPLYILHSGVANPVMELFKLSRNLCVLKDKDPAFSKEYKSLDEQCQLTAVELLDLCSTESEVETLLSHTHDYPPPVRKYPLVQKALFYRQKQFIAHPHCQRVLLKSWREDLPRWLDVNQHGLMRVIVCSLLFSLLLPLVCFTYMLHMWSDLNRMMRVPAVRFITDTASYIMFTMFLLVIVILKVFDEETMLGDNLTWLQWYCAAFVAGMAVRTFKAFMRQRATIASSQYSMWCELLPPGHIYDILLLTVFSISYILYIIQIILVREGIQANNPRRQWEPRSVRLFAEALESTGCVMAYVRICFLFQFNHSLGPLIISLRQMTGHVTRFVIIFCIVISAFGLALTGLYLPYKEGIDDINGHTRFRGFHDTFKTLFWSLFGYGEVGDPEIVNNRTYTDWSTPVWSNSTITCVLYMLTNTTLTCTMKTSKPSFIHTTDNFINCDLPPNVSNPLLNCSSTSKTHRDISCDAGNLEFLHSAVEAHLPMQCDCMKEGYVQAEGAHHELTEVVGYTIFGFYNVLATTVLLNMLIATMANTYSRIEANSDQEWKFNRARMLMSFFSRVGDLPPPFNLIGTPLHMLIIVVQKHWCKCALCWFEVEDRYYDRKQMEDNHRKLMRNLSMRYWYRRYKSPKKKSSDQNGDRGNFHGNECDLGKNGRKSIINYS